MIEVAPAILVYSKDELDLRILAVPSAKVLHIDIMDGKFVNNKTIGPEELKDLPKEREIEFHLMVADPISYIEKLPGGGNKVFQVHIESISEQEIRKIKQLVLKKNSKLALALSPPTPIEKLKPYLKEVSQVLVMTVNPGWAGQKYMQEVEEKIKELRNCSQEMIIEIDGGVGPEVIPRALAAGANRFAAASAVYGQKKPDEALRNLLSIANQNEK